MKKILSIVLALVMMLSMSVAVFAEDTYSITVNNPDDTNVTIAGETFSAYRFYDMTHAGSSDSASYGYALTPNFADFVYTVGGKDYSGLDLIKYLEDLDDDSEALIAFGEAVDAYVTANNITADATVTVAEGEESATFTGLAEGYYLILAEGTAENDADSTVVSSVILSPATTGEHVTIDFKGSAPTVVKKIKEVSKGGVVEEDGEGAFVEVGDVVTFTYDEVKVPNMTGYSSYSFVFTDTMTSGLTFDAATNGNMVVTIGQTTLTADQYKVVFDETTNSFTCEILDFINWKSYEGQDIVITYEATVNKNAYNTDVETNKVKLTYSNDPQNETSKTDTPWSEVPVYDFEIRVKKVDENGDPLEGVKFILLREFSVDNFGIYSIDSGDFVNWGRFYDLKSEDVISPYYANNEQFKYLVESITSVMGYDHWQTTNEDGIARFAGLEEGTYYLIEYEALDGYNLLEKPIKVVIDADFNEDGTLKSATATFDENCDGTVDKTETFDANSDIFGSEYKVVETIENTSSTLLPSTGGIGTTIFYVIGSILVLGSVVVFVSKKRMAGRE